MTEHCEPPSAKGALTAALRANLAKRKAQKRAQAAQKTAAPERDLDTSAKG